LAANGEIVTREQLLVQVWNNRIVGEGAINRTVSLLRSHFLALTDENIIETVPTQGYRLVANVVETLEQKVVDSEKSKVKQQTSIINIKTMSTIVVTLILCLVFFSDLFKAESLNPHKLSLVSGPFIALKGWEYQLSATKSGKQLLFHHLDENNLQSVYLYDTKTHTKQLVLNNSLAAINADGKRIIYSTYDDNQCAIAVYDVLTKQKQRLFSCEEPPTSLVWGQKDTIYFNKRFSKSHPYQVFSYNISTSQLRQLTNPSDNNNTKGDFRFFYNRKNNQLAVIRYINENESKIIVHQEEKKLAEYSVDKRLSNLVWHPNKNALIIADNTNLYILTTSDSQYQLLKQLEHKISSLTILPNEVGVSLLVSNANFVSEIIKYDIKNNTNEIWQQSARAELLPRMQAKRQLILSTRYKNHHWWQINNGEAKLIDVKLPFDLQFVRYELSEDGKHILFTKHGVTYELDLQNNTYQQIFSKPNKSYVANYDSRKNRDVIYSSNHSGQWQLWSYQRATNKHSQLTTQGGYSGRIVEEYLYYSKFNLDGLWRKKLTEPTEELLIEDFNRVNWLNWRVINNQLYFYRKATGIWQLDIKTAAEQLIMPSSDDFVHQYTVSPDQKNIYWVRLKSAEGDIYQYDF